MSPPDYFGPEVHVTRRAFGNNTAACDCAWRGPTRMWRAAAIVDAHDHASRTRHWPARPLVVGAARRSPWWAWTTIAGLIIGAVLLFSAPADASPVDDYVAVEWPAVCRTLDGAPYLATLDNLAALIMRDTGWAAYDAGYVIGTAVLRYCPEHAALLDRYAAVYGTKGRSIA